MNKILITGVSGFAGSHLAEYLVGMGSYKISGTYLSSSSVANLAPHVRKKILLFRLDLQEKDAVLDIVRKVMPGSIIHLAAMPAVGASYERPLETIMNNVAAELSVLEAVRVLALKDCRVLIVSSADVYGKVSAKDIPIDEETPFNPTNTYAVSKIAQDFLALQYCNSYGLSIVRARPFNHIGPRQATGFVVADFAKKIAEIEKGKSQPTMFVGDLSTRRDFTDVRDIIRAYVMLLEKGKTGEVYNIGSGISYKISEILDMLLSLSKVKIAVEVDKTLLRGQDAPDRKCDNRKIAKLIGWKPKIPMKQMLEETLEYWRAIV